MDYREISLEILNATYVFRYGYGSAPVKPLERAPDPDVA